MRGDGLLDNLVGAEENLFKDMFVVRAEIRGVESCSFLPGAAPFAPPAAHVAASARVARNQCPPHQCCMVADALQSRLSGANAP